MSPCSYAGPEYSGVDSGNEPTDIHTEMDIKLSSFMHEHSEPDLPNAQSC